MSNFFGFAVYQQKGVTKQFFISNFLVCFFFCCINWKWYKMSWNFRRYLNSFKYLKIHSSQWLIINVFRVGLSEFWWRFNKKKPLISEFASERVILLLTFLSILVVISLVFNGIYNEPQLLHISIYINNTMIAGEYGNATRKYTSSLDASVKVLTFNWNFEKCHDVYGNRISLNSH